MQLVRFLGVVLAAESTPECFCICLGAIHSISVRRLLFLLGANNIRSLLSRIKNQFSNSLSYVPMMTFFVDKFHNYHHFALIDLDLIMVLFLFLHLKNIDDDWEK